MATVTVSAEGASRTVLVAVEGGELELAPDGARRLAVSLMEAAAEAERPAAIDWP